MTCAATLPKVQPPANLNQKTLQFPNAAARACMQSSPHAAVLHLVPFGQHCYGRKAVQRPDLVGM